MENYFKLVGREAVPVSTDEWAQNFERDRAHLQDRVGAFRVSTIFLGLNHQYGDGPPLIFETMVFAGSSWSDLLCLRYSTLDDAEGGHAAVVSHLKRLPMTSRNMREGRFRCKSEGKYHRGRYAYINLE